MRARAEVIAGIAFVILFSLLFIQECSHGKITPDEDDCRARGRATDCWKAYEFVAPDERSEPRP